MIFLMFVILVGILKLETFKNRFDVYELKNNKEREDEGSLRSAVKDGMFIASIVLNIRPPVLLRTPSCFPQNFRHFFLNLFP